ncbi:MAG: ornithine cyclodeaminase family protein [Lachnospiraceae bacterium]
MLFLNKSDIEKSVDLNGMMDQIEEAYRIFASGEYYMPPRPTVVHKDKTLLYMPCFVNDSFGTKILTVFPENSKLGLPAIDGLMLMNDYETGKPVAMLDGQTVTAYRTGAVGGVGIRHLSRKDCHTVGIVGAGVQGFYQALYACVAREIHTVYVFNHSDRDLTAYLKNLEEAIGNSHTKVIQCKSIEELVKQSEIICTATPAETPVLPNDKALLRGKCIIAIGSYKPTMREIPDAIWDLVDHVYTELEFACEESGDLSQPLEEKRLKMEQVRYMDAYLSSGVDEDEITKQTTYFKSVGMGLFDLCIAKKIMTDAKEQGIGQQIVM